jgi:type IV secretion system protein TrbL
MNVLTALVTAAVEENEDKCTGLNNINPICQGKAKIGDAVSSVAGSAIDKVADAVSEAVGEAVKTVATIWTKVPTVGLGSGETATKLQDNLFWFVGLAAVFSVIIAGGRMAWEARAQPLRDLSQSLITLVLVTGAGLAILRLVVVAGDEFSTWLIGGAGGADFNKKMTGMLAAVTATGGPLGAMLVILVGLILVLASIAQIVLMIARSGMLVLLAGVLPLSAAATNTESGKQWFQKTIGWMIAFALYKPAAALVYAAAFELFGDSKDLMGALTGMTMMVLAVAALPALMKLCVPLVGSLSGGGGGGGMMAGGAMAAQSVGGSSGGPTGAVSQPSQSPASMGTPGSRGSSGPSGAAASGGASAAPATSSAGSAAASGGGAAAASGGGAAAAGGASAAAGPIGAGVAVAAQAMSKGKEAANEAAGDGGPDGSK